MTFSFFFFVLLMIWELNLAPSSVSLSFAWWGTDLGCRGRKAQTMRSGGLPSQDRGHGHQSTSRACFLVSILRRRKERWDFTMTWKASPQSPLNCEEISQAKNYSHCGLVSAGAGKIITHLETPWPSQQIRGFFQKPNKQSFVPRAALTPVPSWFFLGKKSASSCGLWTMHWINSISF